MDEVDDVDAGGRHGHAGAKPARHTAAMRPSTWPRARGREALGALLDAVGDDVVTGTRARMDEVDDVDDVDAGGRHGHGHAGANV